MTISKQLHLHSKAHPLIFCAVRRCHFCKGTILTYNWLPNRLTWCDGDYRPWTPLEEYLVCSSVHQSDLQQMHGTKTRPARLIRKVVKNTPLFSTCRPYSSDICPSVWVLFYLDPSACSSPAAVTIRPVGTGGKWCLAVGTASAW